VIFPAQSKQYHGATAWIDLVGMWRWQPVWLVRTRKMMLVS
jgi:hypothetical protein